MRSAIDVRNESIYQQTVDARGRTAAKTCLRIRSTILDHRVSSKAVEFVVGTRDILNILFYFIYADILVKQRESEDDVSYHW